jgi:hypothetical protein
MAALMITGAKIGAMIGRKRAFRLGRRSPGRAQEGERQLTDK